MNDVTGPLTREAMMLLATTAGPVIGVLLVIGLMVGVFQASTQINDPAVGFLPRLAAALAAIWFLGGWLLERYSTFFATSVERMSQR